MVKSVKALTVKAQSVHARATAVVKALALVVTTGTGTGVSVRKFVFANWDHIARLVEVLGTQTVAALVTLTVFVASVWMCLVAGCFVKVVEAIRPQKKTERRGQARAKERARQGRAVKPRKGR